MKSKARIDEESLTNVKDLLESTTESWEKSKKKLDRLLLEKHFAPKPSADEIEVKVESETKKIEVEEKDSSADMQVLIYIFSF
jgi:hypothetical protein